MEKEFTIKIFKQKAGAHHAQFVKDSWAGYFKNTAFRAGREELIRIANCDLAAGLSKSSEDDIMAEIKAIRNGNNNYYFDQTNYFFKVFSKKTK